MTMNITVKVPDGIVIASDSLASQQNQVQFPPLHLEHKCGQCGHEEKVNINIPSPTIGVPVNSSPLANKLFYVGQYGESRIAIQGRTSHAIPGSGRTGSGRCRHGKPLGSPGPGFPTPASALVVAR